MKTYLFALAFLSAAFAHAADIGRVIVRQQWPWSTAINVDFELSGVSPSAPADISLRCFNGASEIPAATVEAAISGARYALTEGGTHTLTLDPAVLFPSGTKTVPDFRVTVAASATSATDNEVIYKIINLADGATTNLRRADFYNHPETYGTFVTNFAVFGGTTELSDVFIWTGVTNNTDYTSSKLVLRKIPAAGAEWQYGSETSLITGKLTNDYWIGVFPLTQAQYYVLKSSYGVYYTNAESYPQHERFPVTGVAWRDLSWRDNPIFPMISSRTGLTVDFPTEMQWEFAARGGQSGVYGGYSSVDNVAWYRRNAGSHPLAVGQKRPNAFGLYDTLGNVWELCRDWYGGALDTSTEKELVDDLGVTEAESGIANSGTATKAARGGYYDTATSAPPTIYTRNGGLKVSSGSGSYGVRIWAMD